MAGSDGGWRGRGLWPNRPAPWPPGIRSLARMVMSMSPDRLPSEPWALKVSRSCQIGKSTFRGGPYVTVVDNESWLSQLKLDVMRGPGGPRSKTGALQEDLKALARVISADVV